MPAYCIFGSNLLESVYLPLEKDICKVPKFQARVGPDFMEAKQIRFGYFPQSPNRNFGDRKGTFYTRKTRGQTSLFWDTIRRFRLQEEKNWAKEWEVCVVKQCFKLCSGGSFTEFWFYEVLEKSLLF